MRQFKIILAVVLTLGIGGCAALNTAQDFVTSLSQPASLNTQYEVESAVYAVRRGTVEYFRLRQCRKSEVASPTNLCSRYAIKVKLQAADLRVRNALAAYRANPAGITALRAAIADYQRVLAEGKVL